MTEPYFVLLTRPARKDLDKLDRQVLNRVAPELDALAADPRPAGCLKVTGRHTGSNACPFAGIYGCCILSAEV